MPTPIHNDVFMEVVNNLMKELHAMPFGANTIFSLVTENPNSPVLPMIQHLSLSQLNTNQMSTLLPALSTMTGLLSLALPICKPSPYHLSFLLAECPAFSKLQSLNLGHVEELNSDHLLLLSQSTTLTSLTSLNFTGCKIATSRLVTCPQISDGFDGFGSFGAAFLSSHGKMLVKDSSHHNQEAVNDFSGLIALLSSPVVKNLTHLNLGNTDIDDPLVHIAIATSPFLSNLVSLDLTYNTINHDAVGALAASTTLTKLVDLNLANTFLGDGWIARLLSPPSHLATKLQSIDLCSSNITTSTLYLLLKTCPHLSELVLRGNGQVGPAGAEFIARYMPNLTKLDLTHCCISDRGYAALAASTALTNLRELNLTGNEAVQRSIIALVNSPVVANLTKLDLNCTHHNPPPPPRYYIRFTPMPRSAPELLTAIAQSPSLAKLQHLGFHGNQAGDLGVIELAQSTTLTNLTWLDLGNNDIGPSGVNALCTRPVVSKLTYLGLSGNPRIGNSVVLKLAAPSSTLYSLLELNLSGINLTSGGVLRLLATSNLDQLDSLQVTSAIMGGPVFAHAARRAHLARFNYGFD